MQDRSKKCLQQTWLLLVLFVYSASGAAHDFWIEASRYKGTVGEATEMSLFVGEAYVGSSLPRVHDWFHRFDVTGPKAGEVRSVDGELGDTPAGRFTFAEPGFHHVAYESTRDFVRLEAAKFHAYLEAEGLAHIIERRRELGEADSPGREFYSRSAKVLTQAGDNEAGLALTVGLPLELVMVSGTRSPSQIRVLFRGMPLAGIRVQAIPRSAPQAFVEGLTDSRGELTLDLKEPGEWLIKAVHMERAEQTDRERADWESWWASLTLKR